jgi:hypothetical protein
MPDHSPSSRPPDPRLPRPADATGQIGQYERPARWQTVTAIVLGVVLVSVPLYLWRRPRSATEPVVRDDAAEPAAVEFIDAAATEEDAAAHSLVLGDPRVLECKDTGSGHTLPEKCDHIPQLEKAFAQAIVDSRDCLPPQPASATITYVADVALSRKKLVVSAPKDGRSVKNYKLVEACVTSVRRGLSALSMDGLPHAHARYKIALSATYPGPK